MLVDKTLPESSPPPDIWSTLTSGDADADTEAFYGLPRRGNSLSIRSLAFAETEALDRPQTAAQNDEIASTIMSTFFEPFWLQASGPDSLWLDAQARRG